MPTCPICRTSLASVPQRTGVYHHCQSCDGRALTIPQLRRVSGDRFSTRLLKNVMLSQKRGERTCPFCEQAMWIIALPGTESRLEACRACTLVWFDAPTYEMLPEGAAETLHTITADATEILAVQRLKEQQAREAAERKRGRNKLTRPREDSAPS